MTEKKRSRGRPSKLGDYQGFALRLPVDLHKQLSDKARGMDISLNDLIVQISENWLKTNKQVTDD
ncbi:MAG: toxin-antitoxin system HicB family antitoxin [Oscillochloris sp.]|nr:toxin-antitoxin system HicB family antitoxin [Oscillochloris sp.]